LITLMVDVHSPEIRSKNMRAIKSANTKPEVLTRKELHHLGYRYRLGSKIGKIRPDIVLPKFHVAIFVHGCYWHQHRGCKLAYSDRDYSEKWQKKFKDNWERDLRVLNELNDAGWRVAIIWECATREQGVFEQTIKKLGKWIREQDTDFFESGYKKK